MMPDAIELVIVTPEKQLLREKVVEVQMPGENGYLGILPGHAPLMTELESANSAITTGAVRNPRMSRSFADLPRFFRTA
jgi:F-type H+-transporting ATPase subunit epsilon